MAAIVNLNRFRKQKARSGKESAAAGNRARFGRTKAEKLAEKQKAEQATRRLDGHRREDPPSDG